MTDLNWTCDACGSSQQFDATTPTPQGLRCKSCGTVWPTVTASFKALSLGLRSAIVTATIVVVCAFAYVAFTSFNDPVSAFGAVTGGSVVIALATFFLLMAIAVKMPRCESLDGSDPSSHECALCKRSKVGAPYAFYYGKTLSRVESAQSVTTRFSMAGKRQAFVCDGCVLKKWVSHIVWSAAYFAVLAGLDLWMITKLDEQGPIKLASWAVLVVSILTLHGMVLLALSIAVRRHAVGIRCAIDSETNKLREAGFDAFWSPSEYRSIDLRRNI
jgi:hypothetical protein